MKNDGCRKSLHKIVQLVAITLPFGSISDREASLIKKEYCRFGPHPLQVISSRARPYLLRERATLAAFSRISGVGHSGS